MSKKKTIPDPPEKLSDLLRLAVRDCKKVEKMKTRKLAMADWHTYDDDERVCFVCMAGAVMDRTLRADHRSDVEPWAFDPVWQSRLFALDTMRQGMLPDWAMSPDEELVFERIVEETYSPLAMRAEWDTYLKAADYLESVGL